MRPPLSSAASQSPRRAIAATHHATQDESAHGAVEDVSFQVEEGEIFGLLGPKVPARLITAIRERGATVVLVTHCMDEAERLCDRLGVIDGGRVVALDTPQGLIDRYGGKVRIRFTTDHGDVSWLETVPNVERVERRDHLIEVVGGGPVAVLAGAELVAHGILPSDFRVDRATRRRRGRRGDRADHASGPRGRISGARDHPPLPGVVGVGV